MAASSLLKMISPHVLHFTHKPLGISCFFVLPEHRRKTVATRLLRHALAELKAKGVKRVEAYPRRGEALCPDDLWNGPEPMLVREGFKVVREDKVRPVMAKDL